MLLARLKDNLSALLSSLVPVRGGHIGFLMKKCEEIYVNVNEKVSQALMKF